MSSNSIDTDPFRRQYHQRPDDCREWEPVPVPIPLTGTVHELKCWPDVFQAMWDGIKQFEFRKDDRDYKVGDVLVNKEWLLAPGPIEPIEPIAGTYTGRELRLIVTFKLPGGKFGVPDGYCVMSTRPAPGPTPAQPDLTAELLERSIALREEDGVVFATEEEMKTIFPELKP